jgi:hypothetical protein
MGYGVINADLMTTSDGVSSAGLYGFKNRIINGAMVIDQRNAGASVTPAASAYTLDRWVAEMTQASKYSIQQAASGALGLPLCLKVTSASAYSVLTGDAFNISQRIEASNLSDLGWGGVNASAVTLSFAVYSSLTGTFGGSLRNSSNNRSYPFTYTISAANTWEQKSITIAGDTSGTWTNTGNTMGMSVQFGLGVGSTFSGTAGSWASANYLSATGATSIVGTSGAIFAITGIQLEKGSTATSFDYRPYTTELQLCQRYLPAISSTSTSDYFDYGQSNATTNAVGHFNFLVTPRVPPTGLVASSASHMTAVNPAGTTMAGTSVAFSAASLKYVRWVLAGSGGLTVGQIAEIYFNNASGYLYFTGCEL